MDLAAAVVRTRGDIALVGIGGGTLCVGFFQVPYEAAVATTYWGSVVELAEVVRLAERGKLEVHVERFSLDAAPQAYDRLAAGDIEGRAVVVPG